jgi:hypothetical protein
MRKQLTLILSGCCLVLSASLASAQTVFTLAHQPQPAALVATVSSNVTICNGSNTVLTGGQTGGTSPFTYAWSPGGSLSSTTNDTTTASPTANQGYAFTVTDSRNCTASNVVTVTVIDCSGMEEIKEIESFNLYPNPSEGEFNVAIQFKNKPSTVLVQIFNMNGELVLTKNYQKPGTELKESFSLQNVAAGNYLMRITVGKHALTKTFIIK